tara:strand:+ start:957 stop:1904 length:948 start_codon:yes stop_codon:yes gene_type:complete
LKNSEDLVTVLIPCRNASKYIKNAVKSITNQSHKNLEIFLLENNSSDNTIKIINKIASEDKRIKVFSLKDSNLIKSLNYGINKSNGEFIARMDADDLSHPDRLKEQIAILKKDRADICGCDFFTFNYKGQIIENFSTPSKTLDCYKRLLFSVPYCHGSLLFRSKVLKKITYDNDKYQSIEDYYLLVKMAEAGLIFTKVKRYLYYLRLHDESFSKNKFNLMQKDANDLAKDFLKKNFSLFNKSLDKSIRNILFSELCLIKEKKIIIDKLKKDKNIKTWKFFLLTSIYYLKLLLYLFKRFLNKIYFKAIKIKFIEFE